MKKFKFETTNYGNDKLPILDVIITNPDNGKKVIYPALLDSGSFMNVFHSDIAKLLDIDLSLIKKELDFGGVGTKGSKLKGKAYIVNIMVAQKGKKHSFDSYVLFTDELNPDGNPLLGRQGFFDEFLNVELSLASERFYLYK